MVLLSRGSKAIWGKAQITLRNHSVTPSANLLLCTNEDITSLRVEGKNKDEVFMKLSVVDLGEEPMKSKTEQKGEKFKEIIELTKILRKYLPSFFGLMLQTSSEYISSEEFKQYEDITKHERLANLLHNVRNLYEKLNKFCEVEDIQKPKSLFGELDTSCLTNKSELVHKFKSPDQIIEMLMSNSTKIALTEHDKKQGVVFDYSTLTKFPWFDQSFNIKRDGVKVYSKMRTRQLSSDKESKKAVFLCLDFLKEATKEKIKDYIMEDESDLNEETEVDPIVALECAFGLECVEHERQKKERFVLADQFVLGLATVNHTTNETLYKCDCGFVAKSKSGLTRHNKRCKQKKLT